ncbi:histone deacetylase complex protein Sin3 [Encephalitozoon intestinalis ATCC 50506]|uniref:Histone deacetylase complex protein Sin3 n=1 Tax=Encephalitozoon intestinalis (strain ATCC 50506) TaxID=876142 RepID=E0SA83_ENCIT|nr:histone deacetylase complex protein Sin3 [Encephalitozoon intestinalis ATCC 50506]ADM12508.1 histone deacetylase complex protein Sin3 [Encephalitozoon intestinalis ATCC 50506]UTX46360.1 paired amphipathic helix protein Sin3b [Encephalitozoon intestinalis]
MPRDYEKNLSNQESESWQDGGHVRKRYYPDEGIPRYGNQGDMRGGMRGYYSDGGHMASSMGIKSRDSGLDQGVVSRGITGSSPPRTSHEDADLSDAMMFLNKIKEEYANDMVTYDNFLETMRDFKFGKIDAEEVCRAVRVLFRDKPHLIEIFNDYLPVHLKFYGNPSVGTVARPSDRQMQGIGSSSQYRGGLYGSSGRMGHPQPGINGPSYISPHHGIHQSYGSQPLVMHSSMKMSGQEGKYAPYDQRRTEEFERMKARQAQDFIQKVKKRYSHNPSIYRSFVEILQSHQVKNGLFEKMKAEVNSLLWESPDLCEDFERNFVPSRRHMLYDEKNILHRIKELLKSKNLLDDFLKCINYFNQKFINEKDLLELVAPLLKNEELIRGFKAFINYKEPLRETPRSLEKYKKEGSYRILPEKIKSERQDPIAREVLNFTCIGCPTFESEDSNYVFLKRNVHEEALFRIEDERSEADLAVERTQYFINALEQIISSNKDSEISMRDIKMSPGIIKEILKSIYGKSAQEILEGILMKPHIAIPIVIKRLYMVNKKLRLCMKEKKKIWREVIERNYHKALDVTGPSYKSSEKSIFTTKNIVETGEKGLKAMINDQEVVLDVMDICKAYIKANQAEGKKILVSNVNSALESVFKKLEEKEFSFVSDFPLLCIFRFVIIIYERLLEIKKLDVADSFVNDQRGRQNETSRYLEVKNLCLEFMKKNVDGYTFEDRIRELTDCKGYKLYNIKKMISKIEKQAIALSENNQLLNSLNGANEFDGNETIYYFKKSNNTIEVGVVGLKDSEKWSDYVEKFETLTLCKGMIKEGPFLPRTCKKPPITGYLKQDLKIQLSPGTYKIKYITESESFYMSSGFFPKKGSSCEGSH